MSKTKTRKQLERAGKDLQKALGCRPRIDLDAEDDELKAKIIEEAKETMITDKLKHSTWKLLEEFEVGAKYVAETEEGMTEDDIGEIVVFAEEERRNSSPVTIPDHDWDDMSQKEQAYLYFLKGARTATELTEALPHMAIGSIRAYVSQWNRDEGPPKNYPYPSVWDNRNKDSDELDVGKEKSNNDNETKQKDIGEGDETEKDKEEGRQATNKPTNEPTKQKATEEPEPATESKEGVSEGSSKGEDKSALEQSKKVSEEYKGYDNESFFDKLAVAIVPITSTSTPAYNVMTANDGGKSPDSFGISGVNGIMVFHSLTHIKSVIDSQRKYLDKVEEALEAGTVSFENCADVDWDNI